MVNIYNKYGFMVRQLVSMDIKKKYTRSVLGIAWSVLNPLLMMVVISSIFTQLFQRSIENYPIYYLSGNIIWTLFTTSTNAALTSMLSNRKLISKISVPKVIFPFSKVCSSFVNFLYILIAYVIILIIFKIEISLTILYMPIILLSLFAFITGLSMILSALYVFFGDLHYLYNILCTALMYTCAIFYPISVVPDKLQILFRLNPMFNYIHIFRKVMIYGTLPTNFEFIQCFGWGIIMLLIGYIIFSKLENKIMLYL